MNQIFSRAKAPVDWERIRRDYATGAFTDSELGARHGVAREVIVRKRKEDRQRDPAAWPRNLKRDVAQATEAVLAREQVAQAQAEAAVAPESPAPAQDKPVRTKRRSERTERAVATLAREELDLAIADGHEAATILTLAEVRAKVIMGHRTDLAAVRKIASDLAADLAATGSVGKRVDDILAALDPEQQLPADVAGQLKRDLRDLGSVAWRISAAEKLARTIQMLQDAERKAHGIEDKGSGGVDDPATLTDRQIVDEIDRINLQLAQITPEGRPKPREVIDVQARVLDASQAPAPPPGAQGAHESPSPSSSSASPPTGDERPTNTGKPAPAPTLAD